MGRVYFAAICVFLTACQPAPANLGVSPSPKAPIETFSAQPSSVISPSPLPRISPSPEVFPTATALPDPDATEQFPLTHSPQLLIKGQDSFEGNLLGQVKIGSFGLHTFDKQGNLYFDPGDGHIWKITSEGHIRVVLGTGINGYKDGPANEAQLSYSSDATFDSKGNMWFLDYKNNVLRWLSPEGQVFTHTWKNNKSKYPFSALQSLTINSYDQIYVVDNVYDPVYYIFEASGKLAFSMKSSPLEICNDIYNPDFIFCVSRGVSIALDAKDQPYIFIGATQGIVRIENRTKVVPLIGPWSHFPNQFKLDTPISSFSINKIIYSKSQQLFFLLDRERGCIRTLTHDGKPGILTSCDKTNQPFAIVSMALHPSEEVLYVGNLANTSIGEEPQVYKISLTDKPPSAYKP
jgi:hypothetical protein